MFFCKFPQSNLDAERAGLHAFLVCIFADSFELYRNKRLIHYQSIVFYY